MAYESRNEQILRATIDGTEYTDEPQSRIEALLLELKETIENGGGGGASSPVFINEFIEELQADNVEGGLEFTPTEDCFCAYYIYSAQRQISVSVNINDVIVYSIYFENFAGVNGGIYVKAGQKLTIPYKCHNIRVRVFSLQ